MIKICAECNQEFKIRPYRKNKARFCSKSCSGKEQARRFLTNIDQSYKLGNKWREGHRPTNAFKKGHIPWTKGKKGIHCSPQTEFKKGCKAINKLPAGSITIRKDKNGKPRRFIKLKSGRWEMFAVKVWQDHHGRKVPKALIIHHRDRDSLNDLPDNLEAMTRAEHIAEHRKELKAG